jgi:tetratricopeptide (TPR) repeat protein
MKPSQQEISRDQRSAELAMSSGRWQRAIKFYTELIAEPESKSPAGARFTFHLNRGLAFRAVGRRQEALEDYTMAAKLNPTSWKPHLNAGLIYAQDFENYPKAIEALDMAVTLHPTDVESLSARGAAKGSAGDIEGAKQDLNAAISLQPDYMEAIYNLGNIHLETGDPAQAARLYQRAQQLAPRDSDIGTNYAIALARLSGVTGRAVSGKVYKPQSSYSFPSAGRPWSSRGYLVLVLIVFLAMYVAWRVLSR